MYIRYGYEDVGEPSGSRRSTAKKTRTGPISTSRLRGWYTGTHAEIARNKLGDYWESDGPCCQLRPPWRNDANIAMGNLHGLRLFNWPGRGLLDVLIPVDYPKMRSRTTILSTHLFTCPFSQVSVYRLYIVAYDYESNCLYKLF